MTTFSKIITPILLLFLIIFLGVFLIYKPSQNKDSILEGKIDVYVEESIFPIAEDLVLVFENQYQAKINLITKSENEIINLLANHKAKVAILPRNLTNKEKKYFENKKQLLTTTPIAFDGIAFIQNKLDQPKEIDLNDIIAVLKEQPNSIKNLYIDDANSNIANTLEKISGINIEKQQNIFATGNSIDIIKYVANHQGTVGVIGYNWLSQHPLELQKEIDQIDILAFKNQQTNQAVTPNQNNLAIKSYPFIRHLHIINNQNYAGLGMGLASFIAGERGQRIVLKADLVPQKFPTRQIMIRNSVLPTEN